MAVGIAAGILGAALHAQYPISDNAMFEYGGRAIARGQVLYRDFWDQNLPGVYYVNALWQLLLGQAYGMHAIVEVIVAAITAFLLALVMRSFGLGSWPIASAMLMILLCLLLRGALNAKESYALPLMLGAVLAARGERAVICGSLIGLASCFWAPSILMLIPIITISSRGQWWQVAVAMATIISAAALITSRLAGSAALAILLHSWVSYASTVSPRETHHRLTALNHIAVEYNAVSNMFAGAIKSGAAVLLALLAAVVRKPSTEAQRFGLYWAFAMLVATCTGTRFYDHYFIPSLAALLFTVSAFGLRSVGRFPRSVLVAIAAFCLVRTVQSSVSLWSASDRQASLTSRLGTALWPVVHGKRTLSADTYQPGLYLALEPKLRSPYEIVSVANSKFIQSLVPAGPPADVVVYTKTEAGAGTPVCIGTTAPWRVLAVADVAMQLKACR